MDKVIGTSKDRKMEIDDALRVRPFGERVKMHGAVHTIAEIDIEEFKSYLMLYRYGVPPAGTWTLEWRRCLDFRMYAMPHCSCGILTV